MYHRHKPYSLHIKTLQLLHDDRRSLFSIHTRTGLSYSWLKKFCYEELPDPSVNRVQCLYEFLTREPLLTKGASYVS